MLGFHKRVNHRYERHFHKTFEINSLRISLGHLRHVKTKDYLGKTENPWQLPRTVSALKAENDRPHSFADLWPLTSEQV